MGAYSGLSEGWDTMVALSSGAPAFISLGCLLSYALFANVDVLKELWVTDEDSWRSWNGKAGHAW